MFDERMITSEPSSVGGFGHSPSLNSHRAIQDLDSSFAQSIETQHFYPFTSISYHDKMTVVSQSEDNFGSTSDTDFTSSSSSCEAFQPTIFHSNENFTAEHSNSSSSGILISNSRSCRHRSSSSGSVNSFSFGRTSISFDESSESELVSAEPLDMRRDVLGNARKAMLVGLAKTLIVELENAKSEDENEIENEAHSDKQDMRLDTLVEDSTFQSRSNTKNVFYPSAGSNQNVKYGNGSTYVTNMDTFSSSHETFLDDLIQQHNQKDMDSVGIMDYLLDTSLQEPTHSDQSTPLVSYSSDSTSSFQNLQNSDAWSCSQHSAEHQPQSTETFDDSVSNDASNLDASFSQNYEEYSPEGSSSSKTGKQKGGSRLPPCRICGDVASGFHYGTNTCEACKGFFRRALRRKTKFVCQQSKKCNVTGERRNLCGYCRYQKCLKAGMSKEAIKTGRYTHEKRTQDTLEIQRIEKEKEEKLNSLEQQENHKLMIAEGFKKLTTFGPNGEDLAAIVSLLIKAQDQARMVANRVSTEFIQKRLAEFSDQLRLQQEVFGPMKNLQQDEYNEIFWHTGLDLDNRVEAMSIHLNNVQNWTRDFVKFVKMIPGFKNLSFHDQYTLLREARGEFWMLCSFRGFDSESNVAVLPTQKCMHRDELGKLFGSHYCETVFQVAAVLQRHSFTDEELLIMKAVCLTAPDRNGLKDLPAVEKIHSLMLACLQHVTAKHHPHDKWAVALGRATQALVAIRDLSHSFFTSLNHFKFNDVFKTNCSNELNAVHSTEED